MAESHYLRYPHIARDLLTFVAEDGVWLASLSEAAGGQGAQARRLTAEGVPVLHPRLNPAGTQVAWTSTGDGSRSFGRGGPREAYAMPVRDGSEPRRLTHWGDRFATVRGWTGDDEVLVLSRTGRPHSMKTWAFAVSPTGPVRELPYGPAGDVSVRADGAVLIGSAMNFEPLDPADWKGYGGGAGGAIWYSPDGTRFERILADVGANLVNPMFVAEQAGEQAVEPGGEGAGERADRVVFLSDHDGTGALYSARPDGSDLRRHTDPGEYYARHATTDGRRVVYQRAGELWLLPSLDAATVRLDVRLGGTRSGRMSYVVPARAHLNSFALDAAGDIVAAEVRGTVHWLPAREGEARALLATPGVRGRLPVVVPGRDAVVCASDSGGEDGLDVLPADGSAPTRTGHSAFGRILELAVAPDGTLAAVACADGRLLTVALSGEPAVTEIARSTFEEVAGLAFSPDSALLAWSQPWRPERRGAQIRLARLADGTVTDVTPPRFDDTSPAFTHDGRYLAFLSNRTFDPIYDAHTHDFGFLPGVRPYLVTLQAATPSPFTGDSPPGSTPAGAHEPAVDVDGLADRIVVLAVAAGQYAQLRAVRDGVVWLDVPRTGALGEASIGAADRPATRLVRYDLARREHTVEAENVTGYAVCADGAAIAYTTGESLEIKPVGVREGAAVDLDRIRVTVEPAAEWRQMYHEAWLLMRDNYWRADLGGLDWNAMGARYRPLLDGVASADDLLDVLRELQGETRTSHTGVLPPPAVGADPALAQGLLGADLERTDHGAWRIARIVPGDSSVIGARSPLAAPSVAAAPGDHIVAVDGRPVDSLRGPNPLLTGKADRPVELTLRRDGVDRRTIVVPLASEHAVRYYDEVARQRTAVRDLSAGRLGYLRIPNVMAKGWADLHRDLYAAFECEGLLVDLRDAMGGSGSDLVAEKLIRRVVGWEVSRYAEPGRYPAESPRGPVVVLTDGYASSGGDFVVQALKSHGVPIVGTRTWGGVIGCDMRYELIDGTMAAQPKYAGWFPGSGFGVDNRGVEPDVEVAMAPHDWAAGRDPQLDAAIRLALDLLAERPAAVPPRVS
ncbi:S41 family peptidase [Hamadaea tsunoensis]|uniref:S41 family peptidase n=1 Tax=Hamadaea tsunoensis TaxID=53368 RepID=UPI000421DBDA|nr:S41 family peptidase [Hamadaea tsunoensis]